VIPKALDGLTAPQGGVRGEGKGYRGGKQRKGGGEKRGKITERTEWEGEGLKDMPAVSPFSRKYWIRHEAVCSVYDLLGHAVEFVLYNTQNASLLVSYMY